MLLFCLGQSFSGKWIVKRRETRSSIFLLLKGCEFILPHLWEKRQVLPEVSGLGEQGTVATLWTGSPHLITALFLKL